MKTQPSIRDGPRLALAIVAAALIQLPQIAVAGSWNAKNVSELVAAINAANAAGGVNTITLTPGKTFTLTAVNNTTDGPNGLPVIAANNNLTVRGNGDILVRKLGTGAPVFRFFNVAPGATLKLENLYLMNGKVVGDAGIDAFGGAILNATGASLTVKHSSFLCNEVIGGDGAGGLGGLGCGGAIRSDGTATLDNVVFRNNQATGGATTNPDEALVFGGLALGGAVSSGNDGNLTVKNCWFIGNTVTSGFRHYPNPLYSASGGGALDIWGTALITDSVFTGNQALGGAAEPGVEGGYGIGGAVSIGPVYSFNPVCIIRRCTFSHNQAIGAAVGPKDVAGTGIAGAVHTGFAQGPTTTTITDCTFTDNQAVGGRGAFGTGQAGAVQQENPIPGFTGPSTLLVSSCVFVNNKALGNGVGGNAFGGGIVNNDWVTDDGSGCILVVSNTWFIGNTAVAAPGADGINTGSYASGGAIDDAGNAAIRNSSFLNNRAVSGALVPGATADYFTAAYGGGLDCVIGTLDVRDSRFVGNRAIGGDTSMGGPAGFGVGGGICFQSGLTANIVNCSLNNNMAVGGMGRSTIPGADGIGGGLAVGFYPSPANPFPFTGSTVNLTGTTISRNQAIGGANGGIGMGGGYAVGFGVFFGSPDTSTVTFDGGSVVSHNQPDNGFQF